MTGISRQDHIVKEGLPAMVNPDASPEEEVAIVDEENNVTGSASRAVMRREGLIHRAVYILVFDSGGRLFVQERSLTKDIFPGFRDLCAGGVVLAGESYEESAARELEEELGVRNASLETLFDFSGEYLGQKVWGRAYSCTAEGPFVLQPEGSHSTAPTEIDAITGATITSAAVRDMLNAVSRDARQSKEPPTHE